MKILSVTAQKPDSTGSGVYLTEVVKELHREGHEQAVLAGVYREDAVRLPEGVRFFPVYFKSPDLPFPILGMSDKMPYESTVYRTMDGEMTARYMGVFRARIREAVEAFRPDLILCHHLYLVTALVRESVPDIPVYGFCHNTDLRQMRKHGLQRAFILEQTGRLDRICALHEAQKKEICQIYPVEADKIRIAGVGYNGEIFHINHKVKNKGSRSGSRLVYAGKISQEKGVASLLRALALVEEQGEPAALTLAGGNGDAEELEQIRALAARCLAPTVFTGRLSQEELAKVYNEADVFVLPSFYEGLPLTVMEALACGCRVVVTDLPGIRPFLEAYVPGAPVFYVSPPRMQDTDRPLAADLPAFETRLARQIGACIAAGKGVGRTCPDLSEISWRAVCARILQRVDEKEKERGEGRVY